MKRILPLFLALTLTTFLRAADQPIDFERAKELFQRSESGGKLTDDEQKYLDEAKRQRAAQEGGGGPDREKMRAIKEKMDRGDKLTDDEQKMVEEMRKRAGSGQPGGGADMERAKQLFEKKQRGENLTSDEEKFLEEAKRQRDAREGGAMPDREKMRAIKEKMDRGDKLTDDEQKMVEEMRKRAGSGQPGGGADMERAKQLFEKKQRGENLTSDEEKFLEDAKRRMERAGAAQAGGGEFTWDKARAAHEKEQRGEALSDDEKKLLAEARKRFEEGRGPDKEPGAPQRPQAQQRPPLAPPPKDLVPLDELTGKYKEQDGGLYGGGKNEPPAEHAALARKAIAEIKPLDRDGKPAADGKVVLMSIGMSNTTMEFSSFVQLANADSRKSAHVTVVDAAQGGKDATAWATADAQPWKVAAQKLEGAGVSPAQVQAVWIKQALMGPQAGFPSETERLRDRNREIVILAKQKYPNLRVAYLSSRIYAGYATTALNPEPYSYESAFAVRWLIEEQMKGTPALNADAAKGEVKAPVLLWGPYLRANGAVPRKSDGLVYQREDLTERDGTHPSESGRDKVAKLLLGFFTGDPLAKPWFAK